MAAMSTETWEMVRKRAKFDPLAVANMNPATTMTMTMMAIIPNPPNSWVRSDNELSTVLSL